MSFQLQQLYTFQRHAGQVMAFAWNPASESGVDGVPVEFATGDINGIVRIWEHMPGITDSFHCKHVLTEAVTDGIRGSTTRSCGWSPDGKLLAIASMFDVTIWENVGGRYDKVDVLKGKNVLDPRISWNASGTLLATCGPGIYIWKVSSGKKFDVVSEVLAGKIVPTIKWHPSKDILFSSGCDRVIKIWEENLDKGKWNCVQTIGEPSDNFSKQLFALNDSGDKIVVSCSCDVSTINIWGSEIKKTETGEENTLWTCLCSLAGHHKELIANIDWSRDGIICIVSFDNAMCFFVESKDDSVDGPRYKLLLKKVSSAGEDMVLRVQWFSKGKNRRLATADYSGTVKIWEFALSSQTV